MTTLGESLSKTTQKQLKAKFPELAEERKGNIQEVLNSWNNYTEAQKEQWEIMEELRAIKESFLEEVSALDDQDRDGEDRLYSSYVSEVSNIADRVMDIRWDTEMNYFILYLPKTDEDVDVSGLFDGISNTKIANNEKETPNEELYWSYKKDFDEMGQMFDYQAAGVINNWENYLKEHFWFALKEKEDINTQAHEILDYLYEFKEENEDTEDYTSIVIDVLNSGASNKAIAKSLNEKGISLVSYARWSRSEDGGDKYEGHMQERSEASWEGWENALAGPSDEKLGDFYYHNSRTPEMVRGLKKYLTEKEDLKKALNSWENDTEAQKKQKDYHIRDDGSIELDSRHSTQEEAFQKIIEDYESLNNTQVKNFSTENGNIIRIDTNSFHKYIDNNDEECFGCYAVNPRGYEYYSNPEDSRYGASLHTTTVDLPLECEDWDRNEILNLMNSKKAKWSGKYTQFYYWTLD